MKRGKRHQFAPSCAFINSEIHTSNDDDVRFFALRGTEVEDNRPSTASGSRPSVRASTSSTSSDVNNDGRPPNNASTSSFSTDVEQRLVLYRKLSNKVKQTIKDLNLSLPGLAYRRNKVKICQHCVNKLENISERNCQIFSQGVSCDSSELDHSYSTASSSTSSESDTDEDSFEERSRPGQGVEPQTSTPKRQRLSFLESESFNAVGEGSSNSESDSVCRKKTQKTVTEIIAAMKELPQSELSKVAEFLGSTQVAEVKRDCMTMNHEFNNIENLTNLQVEDWINCRNPIVLNFVKGVSGRSLNNKKPIYSLAKSIEQIYSTQSTRHVFPLSFAENVVGHSIINSKLAANLNGLSSPSGSYWTLKKWLENQACHPMLPPQGDCMCSFDNDQVIGKSYHVRANNKVKTSVITSVCAAEVDVTGILQMQPSLKPINWMNIPFDEKIILDYESDHHKKLSDIHFTEVYHAIQSHISKVLAEQKQSDDGSFTDEVDNMVSAKKFSREWKICSNCQTHNAISKRLCEACREPLRGKNCNELDSDSMGSSQKEDSFHAKTTKSKTVEVDFSSASTNNQGFDTVPVSQQIRITPRDPIFVNPNSFESVKQVFLEIGKDFRIKKYIASEAYDGSEREWLLLVCDGVPYVLGQKVVMGTYRCQNCNAVIYGKSDFKDHCMSAHEIEEHEIVYLVEFDWVHLRIGFGHYEMNMVRSFFELNWNVMVKDLAFAMGFCTENAQKYAKKGSDHHKSWELLNILYEGSLEELLVPYIRKCMKDKTEPTPEGYLEWTTKVKSPKYQLLQEQILTYAQSILNFRKGVRFNNRNLIMAGKFKHAPIFHGRNHPKYQQIELLEARNDQIMPPVVKEFVQSHLSISQSGISGRGEDMDFILENINKRSKVWTPKGVPTESDWLRTFRNLEKLDKMRTETLTRMGCEDPKKVLDASSSHTPKKEEVLAWRVVLRESNFLANCSSDCLMESVGGEPLDDQLVNLTNTAWSRRRYLYRVFFQGAASGNIPDPIFVLPQERLSFHDIQNHTKEVIAGKIKELMNQLQDDNIKFDFLEEWNTVEKKKKEDYILFYERLNEELDRDNSAVMVDVESE